MPETVDLFGHPPGPAQFSLFGDSADRLQAPTRATEPDPDRVRRRLQALLAKARRAETSPWPEREARMWRTVFPNMANWLPADEADRLRAEFAHEMARLLPA